MSDETPESNNDIIQVAALLTAAATNDERMVPLAKQARKLVLDSEGALDDLFAGYLASKQPTPQAQPMPIPGGSSTPNAVALELVKQAQTLIEGRGK